MEFKSFDETIDRMKADPRHAAAIEAERQKALAEIADWLGTRCERCGKDPAAGLAGIGDDRYCHGSERPSCYELASWGVPVPSP